MHQGHTHACVAARRRTVQGSPGGQSSGGHWDALGHPARRGAPTPIPAPHPSVPHHIPEGCREGYWVPQSLGGGGWWGCVTRIIGAHVLSVTLDPPPPCPSPPKAVGGFTGVSGPLSPISSKSRLVGVTGIPVPMDWGDPLGACSCPHPHSFWLGESGESQMSPPLHGSRVPRPHVSGSPSCRTSRGCQGS